MSQQNQQIKFPLLQWRLRTLMLLVTFVCALLAVRQVVVSRYKQQHAAVRWYQEIDPETFLQGTFQVTLEPAHPTWLGWFFGKETFQDVTRVDWDMSCLLYTSPSPRD